MRRLTMSVALFIQPVVNTTMTQGYLVFEELWLVLIAEKRDDSAVATRHQQHSEFFKNEELINNLPASSGV